MKNVNTKHPSVTIGIQARNEEANIAKLITNLLEQTQSNWSLDKILVCSDHSTDDTEKIVSNFKSNKVELIVNKKRLGLAISQNALLTNSKSDILVLINGDVLPKNRTCVSQLIKPILKNPKVGLVGGKVIPVQAETYFSSVINYSQKQKQELFEDIAQTNPVYLCHGRIRAFAKPFYKQLSFPKVSSEDAFSYFTSVTKGFIFAYQPQAVVLYNSPLHFKDHYNQSTRFFNSKSELKKYFSNNFLNKEYSIAKTKLIRFAGSTFLRDPFRSIVYAAIVARVTVQKSILGTSDLYYWRAVSSTKIIKGART